MYLPLRTIKFIRDKYLESFKAHTYVEYKVDEFEAVYILDDSLVIAVNVLTEGIPVCTNAAEIYADKADHPYFDIPVSNGIYYCLDIEELTYNEINYSYNHSAFIREMEKELRLPYLGSSVSYTRFRGFSRLYWCLDRKMPIEVYDEKMPELKLRERYDSWDGIKYYFIVLEMSCSNSETACVVAYTVTNPHIYVRRFCEAIIRNKRYIAGEYVRGNHSQFKTNFQSWKNERIKERLENHLSYFVIEEFHREKSRIWRRADEICQEWLQDRFRDEERSTYLRPVNPWKSEELMYTLIRKIFKKYNVIYQYRPFFLRSSFGGQMSYDVYIPKLKLAFEYQGQQHFQPVDFFGGEESFKLTQIRDREKQELSKINGVKLIYVNYWEDLTSSLIRSKIDDVIS